MLATDKALLGAHSFPVLRNIRLSDDWDEEVNVCDFKVLMMS